MTITDRAIATLTGTIRPESELLVSPLSATKCVLYDVLVDVCAYGRNGRPSSVLKLEVCKLVPFALELDDGESILVDGSDVESEFPRAQLIPRSLEREGDFLLAYGQSLDHLRASTFEEAVAKQGDRISVNGLVVIETAPLDHQHGYRETTLRTHLTSTASHPLTVGRPIR